jgi:site-specific DNA recombinase
LLVKKADPTVRNFKDAVTLEDLDIEIHLVKKGQIVSKDAKSQAKLIYGINLVLAKNYSENLRDEVKSRATTRNNRRRPFIPFRSLYDPN